MISYKVKGIILAVILSLASIMMPFSVYASVQSTIVPTFSSSSSQWSTHLSITNFSDGTNNQASSTLAFTFDDDYYGVVYFDGYGPSNQHIANFATVYIAGGYGEYRYSYYQNGVINITDVTVSIVNVVKPQSTVDLTQIITLLTAIENDTSSIDNLMDSTLDEIRDVLSELIVSNGYLDTLTQLRYWNVPIESYSSMFYLLKNHSIYSYNDIYDLQYPTFELTQNDYVFQRLNYTYETYTWIFITSGNIANINVPTDGAYLGNWFKFYDNNGNEINVNFSNFTMIDRSLVINNNQVGKLIKVDFNIPTNHIQFYYCKYVKNITSFYIPIYLNINSNKNISTDFAIRFGLSNRLLDDIHIIANGTTSSNSAASDLNDASSDYSSIAGDVVNVENGLTTKFETEVNKIDLNTGLNVFGGYFLTSATWVRTQFDRLTENTPYGSMIVYGLTLGFALLMLGKVFL